MAQARRAKVASRTGCGSAKTTRSCGWTTVTQPWAWVVDWSWARWGRFRDAPQDRALRARTAHRLLPTYIQQHRAQALTYFPACVQGADDDDEREQVMLKALFNDHTVVPGARACCVCARACHARMQMCAVYGCALSAVDHTSCMGSGCGKRRGAILPAEGRGCGVPTLFQDRLLQTWCQMLAPSPAQGLHCRGSIACPGCPRYSRWQRRRRGCHVQRPAGASSLSRNRGRGNPTAPERVGPAA